MKTRDRFALIGLILLAACAPVGEESTPVTQAPPEIAASPTNPASDLPVVATEVPMAFSLTSPAFKHGEAIPPVYSCQGSDISVPLEWNDPPAGTQSLALIVEDPDAPAGIWTHWVIYNIPVGSRGLPKAVASDPQLPDGSLQGRNSWKAIGYGGPCPPSGTHRYFFKLYAVDQSLALESGASKEQVLNAIESHILAQAELMGTFSH